MISKIDRHYSRGSAMVETAMAISFTLVMLFGILQFVIVSYLQVAGDEAVFVAAHEYTLGVQPSAIASAVASMVPGEVASALTYTPAPPPTVSASPFGAIYGTINQNARTGGYTIVRPQNFQVYLNNLNYSAMDLHYNGSNIAKLPISSGAVEGYYLMTNEEMNNFGTTPNDPSILSGNILNPANASPFLPQSDASVANMNTPPYYLPNPIITICSTPWGGAGTNWGQQCPGTPEVWFLGLGEYLENTNYGPSAGTLGMGVGVGDVFQAMAAHQRIYADLVSAFPPIPGTLAQQDATLAMIQSQFLDYNSTSTGYAYADQTPVNAATSNPCTSSSSTYCGQNWVSPTLFPNYSTSATTTTNCDSRAAAGGASGSTAGVPLAWYDMMQWWASGNYTGTRPSWIGHGGGIWGSGETAPNVLAGGQTDGPEGPCVWNGASIALVYYWDQPNFPHVFEGPGSYPPNPLAGAMAVGDPGY